MFTFESILLELIFFQNLHNIYVRNYEYFKLEVQHYGQKLIRKI